MAACNENIHIPNTKWWLWSSHCHMGQTCPAPLPSCYLVVTCQSRDGRNISSINCSYIKLHNNITYSFTLSPGEPFNPQTSLLHHLTQYWYGLSSNQRQSTLMLYDYNNSVYGFDQHMVNSFVLGLALTLFIYHLLGRTDSSDIFQPFDLSHPDIISVVNLYSNCKDTDDLTRLNQGMYNWLKPIAQLYQTMEVDCLGKELFRYYLRFWSNWSILFPMGQSYDTTSSAFACLLGYSAYLQTIPQQYNDQQQRLIKSVEQYLENIHQQLKVTLSGYTDMVDSLKEDIRAQHKQVLNTRSSLIQNLETRQQELVNDLEHRIIQGTQSINHTESMSVQTLQELMTAYQTKLSSFTEDIVARMITTSDDKLNTTINNIDEIHVTTINTIQQVQQDLLSHVSEKLHDTASALETRLARHFETFIRQQVTSMETKIIEHFHQQQNKYYVDISRQVDGQIYPLNENQKVLHKQHHDHSTRINRVEQLINDKKEDRLIFDKRHHDHSTRINRVEQLIDDKRLDDLISSQTELAVSINTLRHQLQKMPQLCTRLIDDRILPLEYSISSMEHDKH